MIEKRLKKGSNNNFIFKIFNTLNMLKNEKILILKRNVSTRRLFIKGHLDIFTYQILLKINLKVKIGLKC